MRCLTSSFSPQFGSASDLQPPKKYLSVFACFCSEACKSLKLWYLVLPHWTNLLCLLVLAVSSAELSLYWTMCQFNVWKIKMFSCSDDFALLCFGFVFVFFEAQVFCSSVQSNAQRIMITLRLDSHHKMQATQFWLFSSQVAPITIVTWMCKHEKCTNSDIVRSESGLIHMQK